MEYTRISILDVVEGIGEDRCKDILSLFSCPHITLGRDELMGIGVLVCGLNGSGKTVYSE